MQRILFLVFSLVLLSACAAPVTPVPTSIPTEIPITPTSQATSTPQVTATPVPFFTVYGDAPIVSKGQPGTWDDRFTDPGAVIYHDGMFHMFRNGFRAFPATSQVGYVTSVDGETWEEQNNGEPIFKSEEVAYAKIAMYASSVLWQDGCWELYFYTWDSPSFPSSSVIGRTTQCVAGPALTDWIPDPEPLLKPGSSGAWDEKQVLAPHVLKTDDGYVMYYSGVDASGVQMIGMATSNNGVTWTKYNDPATTEKPYADSDPVFQPGEKGTWDSGWVHQPRVFQTADGWLMIYRGTKSTDGQNMALGIATSADGIQWVRSASNPVFVPRDIPKAGYLWFHNALLVKETYFLFVEGDVNQTTQIYLATHEGEFVPTSLAPVTDTPTSLSVEPPLSTSMTDTPTVVETASALGIGHIDPFRIVPFPLDPAADFDQVLAEYKKVMTGDPQPMGWFSGTVDGKFNFQLTLNLASQNDSPLVTLRYPIRVEISSTEISAQSLNLIAPIFSGGGGITNSFPSFDLQPGAIELSPSEIFGKELNSGGLVGILYDISAACVQTGVYNVFFQIPYETASSGVSQTRMVAYSMMLACPQEINVWMFNPDDDSLAGTQRLVFENSRYVPMP